MIEQFEEAAKEVFEERAAIAEFDGLLTREEAEKLGLLASRRYLEDCEINEICNMPSLEQRKTYLAMIEKARGKAATDHIKNQLQREWMRRKSGATHNVR